MNITIRETKKEAPVSVSFASLAISQMVTDQHGWHRIKITHAHYLCMKNDTIQVHPASSWPASMKSNSVRYIKIIIEDA